MNLASSELSLDRHCFLALIELSTTLSNIISPLCKHCNISIIGAVKAEEVCVCIIAAKRLISSQTVHRSNSGESLGLQTAFICLKIILECTYSTQPSASPGFYRKYLLS